MYLIYVVYIDIYILIYIYIYVICNVHRVMHVRPLDVNAFQLGDQKI